jgi:glycosyltransferase involved in cell wall biosynthesis
VKFSIVTACRNSAPHLPETIRSVVEQSALTQGIAELEYFIIDGASTDATAEVVSCFPHESITFVSEPDAGLYDAVVKDSQGDGRWVAYLNAGDIFRTCFRVASEGAERESIDLRLSTQDQRTR